MKEKFIKLRELTTTYSETKKSFEEKRNLFNENVKDMMIILGNEVKVADYESVVEFYTEYADLKTFFDVLKSEHPRYGEKRVKEELVNMFNKTYQDRSSFSNQIVDSFLSFENAGYSEVREIDLEAKKLAISLIDGVDTAKNEVVDTTVAGVNKVLEHAKPYTEKAKKTINTGAKILIKLLKETDSRKD